MADGDERDGSRDGVTTRLTPALLRSWKVEVEAPGKTQNYPDLLILIALGPSPRNHEGWSRAASLVVDGACAGPSRRGRFLCLAARWRERRRRAVPARR